MIIVLFVISLMLLATGIFLIVKSGYDEWSGDGTGMFATGIIVTIIGATCIIACIICSLHMVNTVVSADTIDDRLAILEERNAIIEEQVDAAVKTYMQHENETFGKVSDKQAESSIVLVTMYPELASNELVSQLVSLYEKNNNSITQLKLEKATIRTTRWWLYFGS